MNDEPAEYQRVDLDRIAAKWMDRIAEADKREEKWQKDAEAAETAFLCDDNGAGDVPDFNILHSNVETIVPSIYNSTPKPDIRPRHNDSDSLAKQVADVFERVIATQVDDNRLDLEIEASAQDAFMAGRGVVRVKFDASIQNGQVTGEKLKFEVVSWRDYREGPATRWDNVPWVAFRHCVTQVQIDEITDEAVAAEYASDEQTGKPEDGDADQDIWEIWCRETQKVYLIAGDKHRVIKIEEDPLGLPNFFPMAAPVQPITGTSRRMPVCPYKIYRTLAEELDRITRRINGIVKGLKVRGGVIGSAEDIELLASAGDNELVPLSGMEGVLAQGGMDRAVLWWPVDTAITVLRELYVQREQTKQAIYEITGISDIIRGQGAAQETATAQQIKTEWGALRIKKMQRLIERQVRDLFVISAQIISQHFSPQSLQAMSGIEITEQMAGFIQSPLDSYRIDVESDSTVRADLTRGRSEMAEFLQGTAQFFNTMAPIVAQAPPAAGPIVEMYAAFARQFNLGKQAEDALEQFAEMAKQAAGQQQENPEAEAVKAEMEMKAQEMQARLQIEQQKVGIEGQKVQIAAQEAQQRGALEVQKLQLQAQNLGLDGQLKQADLQLKERELGIRRDQAVLAERQAEFDAVKDMAEIEIEQDQQRAAKIGDGS